MTDGTRKVRMVWRNDADQAASGIDLNALEFRMNPIPRTGEYVCLTTAPSPATLLVVGVSHHVTPVYEGVDTLHHVDLFVELM